MNSRVILSGILIAGVLGLLTGCHFYHTKHGNGHVVSRERSVSDFDGVVLKGVGDVNIRHDDNFRVVVKTDSNIQEIIDVYVDDDTLYIDERNRGGFDPTELTINVYMPELKSIKLKGVGDITASGGKTGNLDIKLSGVGNVDTRNYEAENVKVDLSGVGDIKVWVTEKLTGDLSGIGDVRYKGNPSTINVDRDGIGHIKKL